MNWYPQDEEELSQFLEKSLAEKPKIQNGEIHGLIVPHAEYAFSGELAGKAFSLLKEKKNMIAVILGPSHYIGFQGVKALSNAETPLGKISIMKNKFDKLSYEHSIDNQIPFLQKLGFSEILPLAIGELENEQAEEIAEEISKINGIYIFSTDLSHFMPYVRATEIDKKTIEIIEKLDIKNFDKIDACGKFSLLVMMHLCKLKDWKPKLIEYKNSGDITGDRTSVVGYATLYF